MRAGRPEFTVPIEGIAGADGEVGLGSNGALMTLAV
jgi:hypothetical protein